MKNSPAPKILFVCLGNICRSPAAEAVMRSLADSYSFDIDSAGTAGYHIGELADPRMRAHASARGYPITHRARQFDPKTDFTHFDYILAMDASNFRNLNALARTEEDRKKLYRMTSFCSAHSIDEVPDPYYGGGEDFEYVLDILEDACAGLLKKIVDGKANQHTT